MVVEKYRRILNFFIGKEEFIGSRRNEERDEVVVIGKKGILGVG